MDDVNNPPPDILTAKVAPTKMAIESAARGLAATIAEFDPANVIAAVLHFELSKIDSKTGFDGFVEIGEPEYVALLALFAGAMGRGDSYVRRFTWADFEGIRDRATAVFAATREYYGLAFVRANELGMPLAALQFFVRIVGFGIRGPAPWSRLRPKATGFELDGTAVFDSVRLFIECKSGSVNPGARRGGDRSLGKSLREIAVKIDEQTGRSVRHVDGGMPFFRGDGSSITLKKSPSLVRVGVTLDMHFPGTAMMMAAGYPLGKGQHDIPWIVNIVEFAVVLEVLRSPARIIHYLKRRLQPILGNVKIQAFDEYDVLMLYSEMNLQNQLGELEGMATLLQVGLMPKLTAFLSGSGRAQGKSAARPAQPIPNRLKALLNLIERSTQPNRVEVVVDLLDLRFVQRYLLEEGIEKSQQRALRGSVRSVRIPFDETSSIMYVCEDDGNPLAFAEASLSGGSPDMMRVLVIAHDLIGRNVHFKWLKSINGRLVTADRSLSGRALRVN